MGLEEAIQHARQDYIATREKGTWPFDLGLFQAELEAWSLYNFGEQPAYRPLLGVGEEAGELMHAHLKGEQGIRGTEESLEAEAKDAVADCIVYLTAYCTARGWSLNDLMEETWKEVRKRDWTKHKETGVETKTPMATDDQDGYSQ